MQFKSRFNVMLVCIVILLLLSAFQGVLAEDNRINQVHHFGGDSLYCDEDRGCWMLNSDGDLLWEVPQATIDDLFEIACASGMSEFIDAGLGTYGPATIGISCYDGYEPTLKLTGYDEWGKLNTLSFGRDYAPVTAPVEKQETVTVTPAPKPVCVAIIGGCDAPPPPIPCVPPEVGIYPDCYFPDV